MGALLLFSSLLALLVAVTSGQSLGFYDWRVLALLAAWAALTALFVWIERRAEQPIVDMRLFQNRLFSSSLATGFVTFVAIAGTVILMPFYLENVLGYEPMQVGVILAAVPIALGITAPISGVLSDRLGTRPIAVSGLAVLLIGYLALSSLRIDTSVAGYVLRFLPLGIGMGMFQTPNTSAIMGTAPVEQLGVVSGVLAMTRTLGQSIGIAMLGAVWASRAVHYAGGAVAGGATEAAPAFQVAALSDTFLLISAGMAGALLLGLLAWWADSRGKARCKRGR
jgi:MFS family permease